MKRLYNDYEATTTEAEPIISEVSEITIKIARNYIEGGYSLRDVEQVIHSTVSGAMAYMILTAARDKRRHKS